MAASNARRGIAGTKVGISFLTVVPGPLREASFVEGNGRGGFRLLNAKSIGLTMADVDGLPRTNVAVLAALFYQSLSRTVVLQIAYPKHRGGFTLLAGGPIHGGLLTGATSRGAKGLAFATHPVRRLKLQHAEMNRTIVALENPPAMRHPWID